MKFLGFFAVFALICAAVAIPAPDPDTFQFIVNQCGDCDASLPISSYSAYAPSSSSTTWPTSWPPTTGWSGSEYESSS